MSFVRRKIDVTFSLGEGSFGDDGSNTIKVTGLRVSALIKRMGFPGMNQASLRVYGLTLSQMNKLSSLGKPIQYTRVNRVLIEAGDDASGMAVVYAGVIHDAWADMSAAPNGVLLIEGRVGILEALKPVAPISFRGPADVGVILSGLANQMGYHFENHGVTVQLASPYYAGTARDQAVSVAQAGNFYVWVDDVDHTLVICPKDGSRGGAIPLISPQTGMVGYPRWQDGGIEVQSIYNPFVKFGGQIEVQSSITPACGTWITNGVDHTLESETPDGAWFTDIRGYRPGNPELLPN